MKYRELKRALREDIATLIENENDLGGFVERYPDDDPDKIIKAITAIADEIRYKGIK